MAPPCWYTSCIGPSPPPPSPGPHPHPHPHPPPPPGVRGKYRCYPLSPEMAFPFCDSTLAVADRVEWIVQNISAAEAMAIIHKQGVDRLDIGQVFQPNHLVLGWLPPLPT